MSTKDAITYEKIFEKWALVNMRTIIEARNTIKNWGTPFIEVAIYIGFKADRLICKDGTPKRLDVSNRLKLVHDLIAEQMKTDDCTFVRTPAEKCTASTEELIVMIRPQRLRDLSEIKSKIFEHPN